MKTSTARLETNRAWRARNRAYLREYHRKWRAEHRDRHLAHKAVKRAIRSGKLTRPDACQGCKAKTRLQAHHDDYQQRLSVRWLCPACHAAEHPDRH